VKFQIVIDRKTEMIICTELSYGKAHDGTIFKETTRVNPDILAMMDTGYRGIQKVHANAQIPIRHKADIAKLSDEERATRKARNKEISSIRMKIEHIIGRIKVFKIVSERYRNRRKRLSLRLNLVCGIVNFQRPSFS
jgi:hypothetical protein